jgi:hypothetical protein
MGTRLDKIIIGHGRKTAPARRRTSPVSWRCVLPVVPGICKPVIAEAPDEGVIGGAYRAFRESGSLERGVSTARLHVGPKPPGFGASRGVSTVNAVQPSCDARFPLKDAERYALPQELRDVSAIVERTMLKSRRLSAQLPLELSDPLSRAAQRPELLQLVDDPLHLDVGHCSAPHLGVPREVPLCNEWDAPVSGGAAVLRLASSAKTITRAIKTGIAITKVAATRNSTRMANLLI